MQSDQIQSIIETAPLVDSANYVAEPADSRCRYWCKVIRAGAPLPNLASVVGANDVPGEYLRKNSDVEIFEGDYVLEGEEKHHRQKRGWAYRLGYLTLTVGGVGVTFSSLGVADVKTICREAGRRDLLAGAGDVAGLIREINARRDGLIEQPTLEALREKRAARLARLEAVKTAAFDAGRRDGVEWRRNNPDAVAVVGGWDEACINALGSKGFGELCGLTEKQIEARGVSWNAACDAYNAGGDEGAAS